MESVVLWSSDALLGDLLNIKHDNIMFYVNLISTVESRQR
jgi:hypothetical protein